MGIVRGRVFLDREIVQHEAHLGGPWPFKECQCGKWYDPKTGAHAVSMSFSEFILGEASTANRPCPDKERVGGHGLS